MKTSLNFTPNTLSEKKLVAGVSLEFGNLEVLKDFLCPGTSIKFSPHFMAPRDLCDVDLTAAAIPWGVFSKIVWVYKLTVQP